MTTLQKTFAYGGNPSSAPFDAVTLDLVISSFSYGITYTDGKPFITRSFTGSGKFATSQKLKDKVYNIAFPAETLIGTPNLSALCFWRLLMLHSYSTEVDDSLDDFTATAEITGFAGGDTEVIEKSFEGIYALSINSVKYKQILQQSADSLRALSSAGGIDFGDQADELADYIRKNTFIINRKVFETVFSLFVGILADKNRFALLHIIAKLADVSSGKPVFNYNAVEFKEFMKSEFNLDKVTLINSTVKLVKENFDSLFDFALELDEIKAIAVEGTLTIVSDYPVNSADFGFYDLGMEYASQPPGAALQVIADTIDLSLIAATDIQNNSIKFSFGKLFSSFIVNTIAIRVKNFDGSLSWEEQYNPSDPTLQQLDIKVKLRLPAVINDDDDQVPDDSNSKKLYGKVVEFTGECPLNGLTVVVQAKESNDMIWKIVGAATTDGSGNFSMPYPFGIYTSAQAIVSLTPDKPADIQIYTDVTHTTADMSIADDFLYLLLKDVVCKQDDHDDDCDCHEPKKSNRLPDQAELIASDSYTQDIGGSCINLSTPNRTLSEYNHHAIVRTSDPDVANYILTRDPKGNFKLTGGETKIIRKPVDLSNPVRWQDAPDNHDNLSLYQAVTVATGHVLHYKVVTKADGYSLGELVYSLALAPGQKKQIVTFEQTHTLQAAETQRISQRESLASSLVNDFSIMDTISGNLAESDRGSSSATTSGASGGFGLGAIIDSVGISLGISGGVANSNSTASQNSSRALAEFFNEKVRNSITQNAQSYRELNATVVTTVQEGQQYGVTSEVIANHNHCHSLTMMYFEVLRHYAIYQELAYVEECLFIPLLLTEFTRENIFKWRDVLAARLLPMPSETYLQPFTMIKSGRQHPLIRAFDAIERIKTNYANVDFPLGAYDDEPIQFITGEITIHTNLPRPKSKYDRIKSWPVQRGSSWSWSGALIGGVLGGPLGAITGGYLNGDGSLKPDAYSVIDDYISVDANFASVTPAQCIRVKKIDQFFFEDTGFDKTQWSAYATILGTTWQELLTYYFKDRLISEWDGIFNNDIAPLIFDRICNNISLSHNPQPFPAMDFSSEIKYKGGDLIVKVNLRGSGGSIKRNQIYSMMLAYNNSAGLSTDFVTLTVRNLTLRYSTAHYNGFLFNGYIGDDLLDGTLIYAPENANEKRNPRKEDQYLADKLIVHLNSNLEYYNNVLLRNLNEDRRFMLLDGFNIETYDDSGHSAGFRSLASVVKNELLGIIGNSLIMPVAPGYKIDRTYVVAQVIEGTPAKLDLFEHYKPLTPVPPYRVSIPTKGLFAEAVQGACDACEKVKDNTSQDWDKFKPDEPTSINPVTTPVPTVTDWRAAFKDLATPMINIQNAPALPTPGAGLAGVSELLGKSDVFRDVTGLTENQKNALATYMSNQENAKAFAEMAKEMAMQGHNTENADKIQGAINAAKASGAITDQQANKLTNDHLQQMVDGGQSKKADADAAKPTLTDAAIKAADAGKPVKATSTDGTGKAESVDIGGGGMMASGSTTYWSRTAPNVTTRSNGIAKDALAKLSYFQSNITTFAWNMVKDDVFNRLRTLVTDPDSLNQGFIGYCGPAAFFNTWITTDPEAFVDFAIKLFRDGKSNIGDKVFTPNNSLLTTDFAKINANLNLLTQVPIPIADFMIMATLENTPVDPATGKILQDNGTYPSDVEGYLTATNIYELIHDEDEWGASDKDTANKKLRLEGDRSDIIIALDAEIVKKANLPYFPGTNHFVVLTSEFYQKAGDSDYDYFDCWCWAKINAGCKVSWYEFVAHIGPIIYCTRKDAYWYQFSEGGSEIAIGPDNLMYMLNKTPVEGGNQIFRWTDFHWEQLNGGAVKLAAGPNQQLYAVNSNGDMFVQTTLNHWGNFPGLPAAEKAVDITMGASNMLYALGNEIADGEHSIYRFTAGDWEKVEGQAKKIAIDPSGTPWIIRAHTGPAGSNLFKLTGSTWTELPNGQATNISIGADGSVWITGEGSVSGGNNIYKWNGQKFDIVEGGAVKLAVNNAGVPYVINSDGKMYQRKPIPPKTTL